MKSKYLIVSLLALSGLFVACDDEKALTPSEIGSMTDKFEFPQGNSSIDQQLVDVYEKFGVKLIYRDFTTKDWLSTWTPPTGSIEDFLWEPLSGNDLQAAVDMLDHKVFSFIPAEIARKTLQSSPYIFILNNFRQEFVFPNGTVYSYLSYRNMGSMDSRIVSYHSMFNEPDNYRFGVYAPIFILYNFIESAIDNGIITMPDQFYSGIDYTTALVSRSVAGDKPEAASYNNYWARRGFTPHINSVSGLITIGSTQKSFDIKDWAKPLIEIKNFFRYTMSDPNLDAHFEPGGIFEDCPKLRERFDIFINHMKTEYAIDVRAINRKAFEGSKVDTDPTRLTPDTDDQTYIYY